jgi:hypothetical protein
MPEPKVMLLKVPEMRESSKPARGGGGRRQPAPARASGDGGAPTGGLVLVDHPRLKRGVEDGRANASGQAPEQEGVEVVEVLRHAADAVEDGEEQAVRFAPKPVCEAADDRPEDERRAKAGNE